MNAPARPLPPGRPGRLHRIGPIAALLACAWLAGAAPAARADGTGFVVSPHGHILTSWHVVRACQEVRVEYNGEQLPVKQEAVDAKNDLALYRLSRATPYYARFPRRGELRQGDPVLTLGFPLPGLLASQPSVTSGIVSATAGPGDDPRFLQISVPIQSGNSGGPLLGLDGSIFGLVFAKLDALSLAAIYGDIPQTINFAIKEPILRAFLWRQGVPVAVGSYERPRSTADIAAYARPFTVFVSCIRSGQQAGVTAPRAPVGATGSGLVFPVLGQKDPAASWSIQLGAFKDMEAASRALIDASGELAGAALENAEITIVTLPTPSGLLYRAIMAGLDQQTAGKVCTLVRAGGKSCIMLPQLEASPALRRGAGQPNR